MDVVVENGKRTAGISIILLMVMLALFVLPAGAEQNGKLALGVYSGWSFGLGDAFSWHSRGSYSDGYKTALHLGFYAQYNFSALFGLQLNANYQCINHRWDFHHYSLPPDSGTDRWNFLSLNLNGVLNVLRTKMACFYLVGGAGISTGEIYDFGDNFYNFSGGAGVKIDLKPGSRSAINLAGTFHHLLDPDPHGAEHADFLRVTIGYEFVAKPSRE